MKAAKSDWSSCTLSVTLYFLQTEHLQTKTRFIVCSNIVFVFNLRVASEALQEERKILAVIGLIKLEPLTRKTLIKLEPVPRRRHKSNQPSLFALAASQPTRFACMT